MMMENCEWGMDEGREMVGIACSLLKSYITQAVLRKVRTLYHVAVVGACEVPRKNARQSP